jgi:hypothetical protein
MWSVPMLKQIVGIVAVVAMMAGCSSSGDGPATPSPQVLSGSVEPSPTTSLLTKIPPEAFLQPADLGPGDVLTKDVANEVDLHPCGGGRTAETDTMLVTREFVGFRYYFRHSKDFDGYGHEVITSYRAGGAEAYLSEVRRGLAGPCARYEDAETLNENTITAERFGGSDAIRVSRKNTWKANGRVSVVYVAIVRFGDVVVVLEFIEGYDGIDDPANVDRVVAAAINRARPLA